MVHSCRIPTGWMVSRIRWRIRLDTKPVRSPSKKSSNTSADSSSAAEKTTSKSSDVVHTSTEIQHTTLLIRCNATVPVRTRRIQQGEGHPLLFQARWLGEGPFSSCCSHGSSSQRPRPTKRPAKGKEIASWLVA